MTDAAELLPQASTDFERAVARTLADLRPLPAHLVRDVVDPATCPASLLGWLAWALSIDVWRDDWSEELKRHVLARSFADHRLKGTRAGIERFASYAGATILEVTAPPQRFILGRCRSRAELRALYARLPEVRIYPWSAPKPAIGWFFGRMRGQWIVRGDRAEAENEERGELRRDGSVIRLRVAKFAAAALPGELLPFERLYIPSQAGNAFVVGSVRHQRFFGKTTAPRYVATFRRDLGEPDIGREAIGAGVAPIATDPTRVFERTRRPRLKSFMGLTARKCLISTIAADHVYDSLRLWDAAIAKRDMPRLGGSFLGHARFGMAAHTAIVAPLVLTKRPKPKYFTGAPLRGALARHDDAAWRGTIDAIKAAKSLHERVFVDFETAWERRFYGRLEV